MAIIIVSRGIRPPLLLLLLMFQFCGGGAFFTFQTSGSSSHSGEATGHLDVARFASVRALSTAGTSRSLVSAANIDNSVDTNSAQNSPASTNATADARINSTTVLQSPAKTHVALKLHSKHPSRDSMPRQSLHDIVRNNILLFFIHIAKTGGTTLTKELPRLLGLDSPCSFPTCCGDKAARKYAKCLHDGRQAKPNADHFITHKKHKVDCRKCSFWGFELEPAGVSFIKEHFPSRTLILTMIREPVLHVQSQMNHQNYHHHGVPMTPSERIEAWLVYLLGQVEVNGTLRVKQEGMKAPHGYLPFNRQALALGAETRLRGIDKKKWKDETFRRVTALAALKRAKYNLERKIFWFGVTEHYDASICLLMYQLKMIRREKCACKAGHKSTTFNGTLVRDEHKVQKRSAPSPTWM